MSNLRAGESAAQVPLNLQHDTVSRADESFVSEDKETKDDPSLRDSLSARRATKKVPLAASATAMAPAATPGTATVSPHLA